MTAQFNQTIVHARDKEVSARFLSEMLGLPAPRPAGHFLVVEFANGVSLDFLETAEAITPQHYAFLVDEADFDPICTRIQERGLAFWADPGRRLPGEIYHHEGARGLYFTDPDGHLLEAIARPSGDGG